MSSCVAGQRADPHEFLRREVPAVELADGQGRAAQADRRQRGRDARAVGQARVQERALLGDIVPEDARQVADGDAQVLLPDGHVRHGFELTVALDKHPPRSVHHDLGDVRVANEVRDRPQERQDQLEAHDRGALGLSRRRHGLLARAAATPLAWPPATPETPCRGERRRRSVSLTTYSWVLSRNSA